MRALILLLTCALTLSACAPTAILAPTPTATPAATATAAAVAAATLTPAPTVTPTETPVPPQMGQAVSILGVEYTAIEMRKGQWSLFTKDNRAVDWQTSFGLRVEEATQVASSDDPGGQAKMIGDTQISPVEVACFCQSKRDPFDD